MFENILRTIKRGFGRQRTYYKMIDDMLGFVPNNIELYKLALIHKSASFVMKDGTHLNNERLEFLGDAILEAVSSDYLYIEFPDADEGFMTQLRSKIVSRQSLNAVALKLGFESCVSVHAVGGHHQKHIYGDALEAIIGAIYLDKGYEFANRFVISQIFDKYIDIASLSDHETDFKSRLIEWAQKNHLAIKFHTERDASVEKSNPVFKSRVIISGIDAGFGTGSSKKEAEQRAAESMAKANMEVSDQDSATLLDRLDKISPVAVSDEESSVSHEENHSESTNCAD